MGRSNELVSLATSKLTALGVAAREKLFVRLELMLLRQVLFA